MKIKDEMILRGKIKALLYDYLPNGAVEVAQPELMDEIMRILKEHR